MYAKHSCFQATDIASVYTDWNWQPLSDAFTIYLQIGVNYAVLCLQAHCTCCNGSAQKFYLFHNRRENAIVQVMRPQIEDDVIQLYLPNGDKGRFKIKRRSLGFNDEYIIDIAVLVNESKLYHGEKECRDGFFENLQVQIHLKASMKVLSSITTRLRRTRTRDARLFCLWFLRELIGETHICKDIVVFAKLW